MTPLLSAQALLSIGREIQVRRQSFGVARGSILDDHYPMNKITDLPTIDLIGDFSNKDWWHTEKDNCSIISQKSLNLSIQVALDLIQTELAKSN